MCRKVLIVKPEQSGKTFLMLTELRELMSLKPEEGIPLNFIISQNNMLQVKQTGERLNNDTGLIYHQDIDTGAIYVEFSSKSDTSTRGDILDYIQYQAGKDGKPNVLCCGHPKRFADISYIIKRLRSYPGGDRYNINVWCDEADTMISLLQKHIMPIVDECDMSLYCLTATPEKLIKKYGEDLSIYEMENTTTENYYGWSDIRTNFVEGSKSQRYMKSKLKAKYCSNAGFVKYVLKKNKDEIQPGTKWFIPAGFKKKDHIQMAEMLYLKGFNVMIVNGNGITIMDQKTGQVFTEDKNKLPEQLIPDLYEKYELKSHPFALTGNLCIDRGITIINLDRDFQCEYNIMPYELTDSAKISQTAGRIKGNYRHKPNFKIPIVYCTSKFDEKADKMEFKSRELAKIVFNSDVDSMTYRRFKAIRDTSSNLAYSELADGTPFSESNIQWISNTLDPNEEKPTRCKAKFKKDSDGVWVHSDKKKRILGDNPPGGGGSQGSQWTLLYKNCSYNQYTFVLCKRS